MNIYYESRVKRLPICLPSLPGRGAGGEGNGHGAENHGRSLSSLCSLLLISGFIVILNGCAQSHSGSVYRGDQAQREQRVRLGVVESVRRVTIEGNKGEIGAVSGAVVGGVAGSNIGGGKGSIIGSILGAVGGGVAGSAIERGVTKKEGLEITVKLDNGELRAITQEADEQFHPGERVRILSSGTTARVTH